MVFGQNSCPPIEDDEFIKVSAEENGEYVEIPMEDDSSVMLSIIRSQFHSAIGLKYRSSSGAWRAIRTADNLLAPPKGGWGRNVYCISVPDTKRKGNSICHNKESKIARPIANSLLQDLAVMSLPYKTTIEELRDYFETKYGELVFSEIKCDRVTGTSKGYGFIRFKDELAAKRAVTEEHYMDGRKVEVRQKKDKPMKLFVGQVPNETREDDLNDYFSRFGELKDIYIPQPFRNHAFITYASSEDGCICLNEVRHELRGSRLNVMERNPRVNTEPTVSISRPGIPRIEEDSHRTMNMLLKYLNTTDR